MHWILVALFSGALAARGPTPQDTKPAAEDAAKAAVEKQTSPEALAFLQEKVDKVMYNIVAHGAKTAKGTLKVTAPMMGEIVTTFYWRKDPQAFRAVVTLPEALTSSPQMAPMRKMLENQLSQHAEDALLLPSTILAEHNVITMAEDGDLVKLTFVPKEQGMISEVARWFTKEGKIVKDKTTADVPMRGKMETSSQFELMPADAEGKTFLVKKMETSGPGMKATREATYTEHNGFKVLQKTIDKSPMGAQETTCDIQVNVELDPKVFEEAAPEKETAAPAKAAQGAGGEKGA
ncbi:MAG: hypothetical protein AB1486_21095 [Planctomycetota bacterium]